ncbi:hypothetical protein GCM10028857_04530 [Salinarchaeum chitinilyticum]
MEDALDAVKGQVDGMETRPAVFDRELRQRFDRWRLADPVPVEEIIERFARHGGFDGDGATVRIPLHEVDSAELTGEYLLYHPEHVVECVGFYEYARGDLTHIRIEEFAETYPAWRLRFWHHSYAPPAQPSYLKGSTDLADDSTAPGSTVAGLQSVDGEDLFDQLTAFVEREKEAEREGTRRHFEDLSADQFCREFGGVTGVQPAGREVGEYGEQIVKLRVPAEDEDGQRAEDGQRSEGDAPGAPESGADQATADAAMSGARYDNWDELAEAAGMDPDEARPDSDESESAAAADDESDGESTSESASEAFDFRDAGLYPGSEVIVGHERGGRGFPVEAELYEVEGRTMKLGVYWRQTDDKAAAEAAFKGDSDASFVVGELLNVVPFDRQWDAIETIQADDRKADVLTGRRDVGFRDATEVDVRTGDLNEYQARACTSAMRAEDVFCIHGPPGTGKTRTLTKLIREAARDHQRVLAVAHSNQAVDNLLVGSSTAEHTDPRSLHALAQDDELSIARVGSNCDHPVVEEEYVGEDHWQADVVGATMSAAHQFPDDLFDLVVVDEATQATIPATLIPFSKGERAVLAGDHKQLPPYHSGEYSDREEMEKSLFEHVLEVYGDDIKTTLGTQYRMHESIAAFPNEAFYDGLLTHASRNRDWTIGTLDPLVGVDVTGSEERTPRESLYNPAEVDAVVAEIDRLLRYGVDPADIGVITPYTGQVAKLRSALASHDRSGLHHDVTVNTIDSFQGSESEAIIVSFVRSNDAGQIGFLDFPNEGPRRLNVALTRAKKRLVLVGDWDCLTTLPGRTDPAESATPVYQKLHEHLQSEASIESVSAIEEDAVGRPE